MVRWQGWESVICNLSHSPPPFQEHWEWPCNATGLHLPQHTWVKPIWPHKPVYIQGGEVYLNLVFPILILPNLVYSRYLLTYLNNTHFSWPVFPLLRTWLDSSDSHHGYCTHGNQKSAMNSSYATCGSHTISSVSSLGTMEKTTWVVMLFSNAPRAC